ncbi:hypothetical protein J2Z79_001196 [Symbiobacterium terraclitae]|uniref:Uncharacterized protein n=1 Tax=Symbiobacterium terraclitae TaxID=557451 RepID=A0ABS4JS37_9FIRM|nr:hypothetical protein [Symbiobacterium terraclitae]MBP2017811.1 hypothetical protein [Symbiobacterium terraclitae]
MKRLPFIAIPSKTLPDVLSVIADFPPGERADTVIRALAAKTGNSPKTTEEYLRSLRRLGILVDDVREVRFTPSGTRIWEEMRAGSWRALKEHLESTPEVRDLMLAASKIVGRGTQLVQSEHYYKLVASVMERELGYSKVSPRRVDNYLSLFKQCGLINDQFAGARAFVPSEIKDHLELAQLLRLIFAEARQNNPVLEKIPYIPIEDVESLLVSESRITPDRLWNYLVRLWQEDFIDLLQTKLSIANQLGIRTYSADGFLFTSIALRDGDKVG